MKKQIKLQGWKYKLGIFVITLICLLSSIPKIFAIKESVLSEEDIPPLCPSLKIRYAKPKDEDYILRAHNKINEASDINETLLRDNIRNDLFGEKPKFTCLIAKIGCNYVGTCSFSEEYRMSLGVVTYVSNIYIEPKSRGEGVLEAFGNTVIKLNKSSKFFTCLIGNNNKKAMDVMTKLGFEEYDLKVYYKKNESCSVSETM